MAIEGLGFPFVIDTKPEDERRDLAENKRMDQELTQKLCEQVNSQERITLGSVYSKTQHTLFTGFFGKFGDHCKVENTAIESENGIMPWGHVYDRSFDYSQLVSSEVNHDYAEDISTASTEGALTCYSGSPLFSATFLTR